MIRTTPVTDPRGRARARGSRHHVRRGFTLLESLLAAVVLAVAVLAVAGTLSASSQQTAATTRDFTALSLGRQLMEEVAARAFAGDVPSGSDQPGFTYQNDRSRYDDHADFNGYWDTCTVATDGTVSIVPGTANSASPAAAPTQAATLRRSVFVQYRSAPDGASVPGGDLAVVTVTVSRPGAEPIRFRRLFTRTTIVR